MMSIGYYVIFRNINYMGINRRIYDNKEDIGVTMNIY